MKALKLTLLAGLVVAVGCVGALSPLFPGYLTISIPANDGLTTGGYWTYATDWNSGYNYRAFCFNDGINPTVTLKGATDDRCTHPSSGSGFNDNPFGVYPGFYRYFNEDGIFASRMAYSYYQWSSQYMTCDLYSDDGYFYLGTTFDAEVEFHSDFIDESDCDGFFRKATLSAEAVEAEKSDLPRSKFKTFVKGDSQDERLVKLAAERKVFASKEEVQKSVASFKARLAEHKKGVNEAAVEDEKEGSQE